MFKTLPNIFNAETFNKILEQISNISLGEVKIPNSVLKKNILMTGACGTGKTVAIKSLIAQIRTRGERAVIYDAKGEFTKEFFTDEDIAFDKFINVQEWMNNWTGFLFVTNDVQIAEVSNQLLLLPDDNNRNIWMIFDGFDTLPEIPLVIDVLKSGRSKGAQCVFSIQNTEKLTEVYSPITAASIVASCSTNVIFRTNSADAEFFSKFLGQVVVSPEIATQKSQHFIVKIDGFGIIKSHVN